jgi:hypothetical protein
MSLKLIVVQHGPMMWAYINGQKIAEGPMLTMAEIMIQWGSFPNFGPAQFERWIHISPGWIEANEMPEFLVDLPEKFIVKG